MKIVAVHHGCGHAAEADRCEESSTDDDCGCGCCQCDDGAGVDLINDRRTTTTTTHVDVARTVRTSWSPPHYML